MTMNLRYELSVDLKRDHRISLFLYLYRNDAVLALGSASICGNEINPEFVLMTDVEKWCANTEMGRRIYAKALVDLRRDMDRTIALTAPTKEEIEAIFGEVTA